MCVAIYKPSRKTISKKVLKACSEQHPHGCGFAFVDSENILQISTQMGFKDFYEEYREAFKENPESPFLIHFRYATQGSKTLENCHPFQIDENHVFMHNGTIHAVPCGKKEDKSDTRMFNETVLQKLPEGWTENEAIQELIEEYIGKSKLVVMNSLGEVKIYNESAIDAAWREGCWFSNTRHEWRLKPGGEPQEGVVYNGIRRRWVNNKCEAWCPLTLTWRPFNVVSYTFTDTGERFCDVEDEANRRADTTQEESWHKCSYCHCIVPRKDCNRYISDGISHIACTSCADELKGWGMEMFLVVGGYLPAVDRSAI